jgi:hypothetical protein
MESEPDVPTQTDQTLPASTGTTEISHPMLATLSLAALALVLIAAIILDWNGLLGTPARSWPHTAWFAAGIASSPDVGSPASSDTTLLPTLPTATTDPSPAPQSIRIGWSSAHPGWIWITLNQYPAGSYRYTCNFSSGGRSTFALSEATEPQTWDNGRTCADTRRGDIVWVTINSVVSNKIEVP